MRIATELSELIHCISLISSYTLSIINIVKGRSFYTSRHLAGYLFLVRSKDQPTLMTLPHFRTRLSRGRSRISGHVFVPVAHCRTISFELTCGRRAITRIRSAVHGSLALSPCRSLNVLQTRRSLIVVSGTEAVCCLAGLGLQ